MDQADIFRDAFGRLSALVGEAVAGLTPEQLNRRLDPEANSISWLIWHLTRVLDGASAPRVDGAEQWAGEWRERFDLDLEDPNASGYGHTSEQVGRVQVGDAELLTGYLEAVMAQVMRMLDGIDGTDLDRVIDTRWDPPVTLGVRLVSILEDALQHVGQAALLRGLALRGA